MPILERVSGAFINLPHGLLLRFLINPVEVVVAKNTTYASESRPGIDGQWIHWQSGGEYKLSFELFFDSTDASKSASLLSSSSTGLRILGGWETHLMGIEAILQCFMRPARLVFGEGASGLGGILQTQSKRTFVEPPDCYFIYGVRWYRTKLLSAPITETMHSSLLSPKQITVPVELMVLESGEIYKIEESTRIALAVQGGLSSTGLGVNILGDIVGGMSGLFR